MMLATYVQRSLRFHWRTHLAVVLGSALATAILTGALVVGDSVRFSLERLALLRLGKIELAVSSPNRFFRTALADDLQRELHTPVIPALLLRGIVSLPDGSGRVNRVQIVGVDDRFWFLGERSIDVSTGSEHARINSHLADRLGWQPGQAIVLRVEKPSWLPQEAPLGSDKDTSVASRVQVNGIVADEQMGRFSLEANQTATPTLFVPLDWLQKLIEKPGRANLMLCAGNTPSTRANEALRKVWRLDDADLQLRELSQQGVIELRTSRVFLEPGVASTIINAQPSVRGVLTYFVNELRKGDRATPYSLVTAMQGGPVPAHMAEDEILLNAWLADDLRASEGDTIELRYFVAGPQLRLEERTSTFRVRGILPMKGAALDRELMPDFPGLHDSEDCRDWDAGIPIDFKKIRDKDERYWDDYRGTPKAFISLAAGQRIWDNRFGNLTALRFTKTAVSDTDLENQIRTAIDPASVGLFVQPARAQALAAARQSMNFGQLFLGLSLFLIIAALILTGLLFSFGIEQRSEEIGILRAVGLSEQQVRRLLAWEGIAVAGFGAILGVPGGVCYTKAALWGLSTVWRDAVNSASVRYHADPITLVAGTVASVVIATLVIWLAVRRHAKLPARVLLASSGVTARSMALHPARAVRVARRSFLLGSVALIAALAVLAMARHSEHPVMPFFTAGVLFLLAGIWMCDWFLADYVLEKSRKRPRLTSLAMRNSARRRGRSLATVSVLACGVFLVVAVGANRHEPSGIGRDSGTGGFDWYCDLAIGFSKDLNQTEVREALGLPKESTKAARFVPLRVHDGDDASCLNLNRAQSPRILGVDQMAFATPPRFTFRKAHTGANQNPWEMLAGEPKDGAVPAIGDENTIVWGLGKSVGDTLPYTDEAGRTFQLRIVGMMANSILQGSLVISEKSFVERFPSENGYRLLLVEETWTPRPGPFGGERSFSLQSLRNGLRDFGIELTSSSQRLNEFSAVENTYLAIFGVLGGLGLLLGGIGVAIVVLRNVLERRGELAILRALGFRKRTINWMILAEHWNLILYAIAWGGLAGAAAVYPVWQKGHALQSLRFFSVLMIALLVSGVVWVWLATRVAMRGQLLRSLRNE